MSTTFAGCASWDWTRAKRFEDFWSILQEKIIDLYIEHRAILDAANLHPAERTRYQQIVERTADRAVYERALFDLSRHLSVATGERVVVLIDEYDEPLHAGYLHGYSDEVMDVIRNLLGAVLKSNPHVQFAVVTGILRVAKENLFSGLNNLAVYSLLAKPFHTCFGFTESEVISLLERNGQLNHLTTVRSWYNGYVSGGEVIYNPWSILCYLDSGEAEVKPYWLSTSSNELVRQLLERYVASDKVPFDELLQGNSIERLLDENVALGEIGTRKDALWSLLVQSGYLKAEKRSRGADEQPTHLLSIPNQEVRQLYSTTFVEWMTRGVEAAGGSIEALKQAIISGDAPGFQNQLQRFVTNLLSYHDPGALAPERVYHAFLVGLLAVMEPAHAVRSNRESGKGRPDVLVRPMSPGSAGVVMELKVVGKPHKTLKSALQGGLKAFLELDYGAELRAAGADPIHAYAIAFDGKEVRVGLVSENTGRPRKATPRKASKRR
ncbi:MAG: AAA family ATPase [Polyangiaceae bacterium]|nr:AAA family ATPase [Polyangiaceae bacterium]